MYTTKCHERNHTGHGRFVQGTYRPRKKVRGHLGRGHSEHMTLIVPPLSGPFSHPTYCCTEAEFSDEIQAKVLRVFLLAIHSHLYSFALRFLFFQSHATSYSFYRSFTVHFKGKRRKTLRKPHPLQYGLRNPFRNLKSENSQD